MAFGEAKKASISALTILPFGPVGVTSFKAIPCSKAKTLANGEAKILPEVETGAAAAAAAFFGASSFGAAGASFFGASSLGAAFLAPPASATVKSLKAATSASSST